MRMTTNARAQMDTSQVFIYIMVIVVSLGILIYGYNAIKGFRQQADDITYIKFQNTLKNDVSSISYGSVSIKDYELPTTVVQVCFKDKNTDINSISAYVQAYKNQRQSKNLPVYDYPLIESAIKSNTDSNVFIQPKGNFDYFSSGKGLDLGMSGTSKLYFTCFDVKNGALKLRLQGEGGAVGISQG